MSADPRIARGMAAQLARRDRLVAAGHARVGWKIGFNTPRAQRALGLDGPVVGHLTLATVVVPGVAHALAGAVRPAVEPEVAVHLGADVPAHADRAAAATAITGLAAALELIDYDRPLDDLETILAANCFHRAVAFGPTHPGRAGGATDGLGLRLLRNGAEVARADAAAAAGDLVEVVRLVARFLAPFGDGVRAGDRIIAGGLVASVAVAPGDAVTVELGALGGVDVRFVA